jgi:hypothetical protein
VIFAITYLNADHGVKASENTKNCPDSLGFVGVEQGVVSIVVV